MIQDKQDRIRVLHLITHLGVGGALDNTLLTVERLPRGLYEVDLAAGQISPDDGYSDWEQRSRECADRLHIIPSLQRRLRPREDIRAYRDLIALIRDGRYHIVHTHCAKAGVLGRLAAYRAGVPVVTHTCHAFGSQVVRDSDDSLASRLLARSKEQVFIRAERYAGRISDRLITVCAQNRSHAIKLKLAPPERITVIHSGIEFENLRVDLTPREIRSRLELDSGRPVVAFIGRLAPQKAPLDFVAAAHYLIHSGTDAQFIIAGDGPLSNQVLASIRNQPRIRCLGFYEHVAELLSVANVLAVSSLWEGLGRSVTEAMIMGVPVAATRVDGIPELVSHGETGLLSPPRDVAALAENIRWLLDHPEQACQMAERGCQRVGKDFDANRMVDRISDLYQVMLTDNGVLTHDGEFRHKATAEEAGILAS